MDHMAKSLATKALKSTSMFTSKAINIAVRELVLDCQRISDSSTIACFSPCTRSIKIVRNLAAKAIAQASIPVDENIAIFTSTARNDFRVCHLFVF